MQCSKDEFNEWKHSPVTKALGFYIKEQIENAKEVLANDAGKTPLADRELVGGIAALKDVLDWQPDYIEES